MGDILRALYTVVTYCDTEKLVDWLGRTKLILYLMDCLGQKHDPVGRQKNKNKNDQTSYECN